MLAPRLDSAQLRDEALSESLQAVRRSRTLQIDLGRGGAVPRLAEPWRRDEAVSECGGGAGGQRRVAAVRGAGGAVPRLAELGRPAEALEAARAIGDSAARGRARRRWCCGWPSWAGPPRPSRRRGRSATSGGGPRLAAPAPRLAELGRPAEALEAEPSGTVRLGPMRRCSPHFSMSRPSDTRRCTDSPPTALTIENEWRRAEVLAVLVPRLDQPSLRDEASCQRAGGGPNGRGRTAMVGGTVGAGRPPE